jgi:Carboxylesterase family
MWTLLLSSFFLTAFLAECHPVDYPCVQIGDTTLTGKRLQPSNLEFFGGYYSPISNGSLPYLTPFPGIPFAEPPVDGLRFSPPRPKYSLSPLQSFDARDFGHTCLQPVSRHSPLLCLGTHSFIPHSYCSRICQRTVSRLTYLGLPVLTLAPLCP